MKILKDLTTKELTDRHVQQTPGSWECWFASSTIARNIISHPASPLNYVSEKSAFYFTQIYKNYEAVYRTIGISPPPDIFTCGAGSDIIKSYLEEMTKRTFNIIARLNTDQIFSAVESRINAGQPVILITDNKKTNIAHCRVVVGYETSSKIITYLDPLTGPVLIESKLADIKDIVEIIC